jgi:hypothetical protein
MFNPSPSAPAIASGFRIYVPSDSPAAIQRLLAKAARRKPHRSPRRLRTDLKSVGRKP